MGLCLEADYKLPAVGERQGFFAFAKQVPWKSLRLYGWAPSPFWTHPSIYTMSAFFL
jgi:hypothetical protein